MSAPKKVHAYHPETRRAVCGAKTRKPNRFGEHVCLAPPMVNGRCRRHGGSTPCGIASPHYKHGKRSKYLPTRLVERYEQAIGDQRLLELRDEIAVTEVRIAELLKRTANDDSLWEDVLKWVDKRRRLVESETKRLVQTRQTLTLHEVMAVVSALTHIINENVTDYKVRAKISREIAALISKDER